MLDAQLDRLVRVLRHKRIWALNVGENFATSPAVRSWWCGPWRAAGRISKGWPRLHAAGGFECIARAELRELRVPFSHARTPASPPSCLPTPPPSSQAWRRFADALPGTAVGHLFVSEQHLVGTDLKERMRAAIRANRK